MPHDPATPLTEGVSHEPVTPAEAARIGQASLIRELVDLHRLTENILLNMGSGLVAINDQGIVTHFNEQAAAITGVPAPQAIGRPCEQVFATSGGGPSLLRRALTTRFGEGEIDLATADGRTVPVALKLTPLEDGAGHTVGVVAIFADLTDSKHAEEQSRRKERLVSLGELSAGVAHEIRNPLAGIGAAAQVLKKRLGGDDDRIRFTDIILEEVGRLDKIVENLLRFARPVQPQLKESAIGECVSRVLALVAATARERGVQMATNVEENLPPIFIDEDQIVQVLLNVIQNALQAMPGGGTLSIAARKAWRSPYVRRSAGRRASDRTEPPEPVRPVEVMELVIRDTGDGIPRETLDRIFDPFFTTRRDGTGLGLSISQSIIREHAGFISIDSRVGQGTTVSICLPLEKRHGQRRRS